VAQFMPHLATFTRQQDAHHTVSPYCLLTQSR
jgi:hypothetical protein